MFNDDLFEILQNKPLGLRKETVYTGSPACCDDDVLLNKFKEELQIMLNKSMGYSRKHRYEILPTKTNVVVVANQHKMKDNTTWTLSQRIQYHSM